jgi:hypothetical protein
MEGNREGEEKGHTVYYPFLGTDHRAILENMLDRVDFRQRCAVLDLGDVCCK